MTIGQQDYAAGMVMARIVPTSSTDPFAHRGVLFKDFAQAIGFPNVCWLIEVSFKGDERVARYFTGECEAGWVGCTTIRPDLAQKYSSKDAAETDIAKLAPRLIGEWVAREHGFS